MTFQYFCGCFFYLSSLLLFLFYFSLVYLLFLGLKPITQFGPKVRPIFGPVFAGPISRLKKAQQQATRPGLAAQLPSATPGPTPAKPACFFPAKSARPLAMTTCISSFHRRGDHLQTLVVSPPTHSRSYKPQPALLPFPCTSQDCQLISLDHLGC